MMDDETRTPEPETRTLIQDQDGRQLARLDVALWPHVGAVIELEPPRSAIVTNVRLRLGPLTALILIDVESASLDPDLANP
jgi:hypothetical protein